MDDHLSEPMSNCSIADEYENHTDFRSQQIDKEFRNLEELSTSSRIFHNDASFRESHLLKSQSRELSPISHRDFYSQADTISKDEDELSQEFNSQESLSNLSFL